jgi:hypothetical protein
LAKQLSSSMDSERNMTWLPGLVRATSAPRETPERVSGR